MWTGDDCATKSCLDDCSSKGSCVEGSCQCEEVGLVQTVALLHVTKNVDSTDVA